MPLYQSFNIQYSSPSFLRVACPHPCTRPCRPRSSSLSSLPSPSASASRSGLVTVYIVSSPSPQSPRLLSLCRHSRRRCRVVFALSLLPPPCHRIDCRPRHYPHPCHRPHPLCPRPRHHRPHCPSPLPLFSVRLTVALASHIIPMLALRGVTASRWRWLPDSCGFCVLQASTVGLVTLSRPECVCLSCRLFIAYLMTHLVFLVSLRPHCCKLDLLSTSTPRCFELVIRSFTC